MQVITGSEGESRFNFEQWISQNGLSEIKGIFERHNANTFEALDGFTPQFQSVMADTDLLVEKRALVPVVLKAMQTISQYTNDSAPTTTKQRVVITEAEEIAMDKAAKECVKITEDALKFEET